MEIVTKRNGTRAEIPLMTSRTGAKGFDALFHNKCFADTKSARLHAQDHGGAQAGTPTVVIMRGG